MSDKEKINLTVPISLKAVTDLKVNDEVYVNGSVYTMMYPNHFTNIINALENHEKPAFDLNDGIIYHTGTIIIPHNGSYDLRAIGTTTSSKFNKYMPQLIRLSGVRAIIGKGGMDEDTLQAMKECGCVYLSAVGGCSAIYTHKVAAVEDEFWPEKSWANSSLKLRLENFGPLFVAMDAHGNSIYKDVISNADQKRQKIYHYLNILS